MIPRNDAGCTQHPHTRPSGSRTNPSRAEVEQRTFVSAHRPPVLRAVHPALVTGAWCLVRWFADLNHSQSSTGSINSINSVQTRMIQKKRNRDLIERRPKSETMLTPNACALPKPR